MEHRWQESTAEQIAQDLDIAVSRVENFVKKKQKEARAAEQQAQEELKTLESQNKRGLKPANENLKKLTVPGHKGLATSSAAASEIADEFFRNTNRQPNAAYKDAVTKAIDD